MTEQQPMKTIDVETDEMGQRIADRDLIEKAVRQGTRAALIRHKRKGVPVVVSRDGKMVKLPAEQIVIPPVEV